MKNQRNTKIKELVKPTQTTKISVKEAENLCAGFTRRPGGCGYFDSIENEDDILF